MLEARAARFRRHQQYASCPNPEPRGNFSPDRHLWKLGIRSPFMHHPDSELTLSLFVSPHPFVLCNQQARSHPQSGASLQLPLSQLRQDLHPTLRPDRPHPRPHWRASACLRVVQQGIVSARIQKHQHRGHRIRTLTRFDYSPLKLGFELARTPQEDPHRSTPIQVSSASKSSKRGCTSKSVRQESDLVLIAANTGLWKVLLPQDYTHQAHAPQPCRRRRHIHGHRPHSEHPQQLVLGRAQCASAARTLHIPART